MADIHFTIHIAPWFWHGLIGFVIGAVVSACVVFGAAMAGIARGFGNV